MNRIGVIVNTKRPRAEHVLAELRSLAEKHGFPLYAENAAIARILGGEHRPIDKLAECIDIALSMGG